VRFWTEAGENGLLAGIAGKAQQSPKVLHLGPDRSDNLFLVSTRQVLRAGTQGFTARVAE